MMAARGLFRIGFTVAEVLAIQAQAKALILEGKTVMSYSDDGTDFGKEFALPPATILEECRDALQYLDPDTYGRDRKMIQSGVPSRFQF
jgi:hypothetical protein